MSHTILRSFSISRRLSSLMCLDGSIIFSTSQEWQNKQNLWGFLSPSQILTTQSHLNLNSKLWPRSRLPKKRRLRRKLEPLLVKKKRKKEVMLQKEKKHQLLREEMLLKNQSKNKSNNKNLKKLQPRRLRKRTSQTCQRWTLE